MQISLKGLWTIKYLPKTLIYIGLSVAVVILHSVDKIIFEFVLNPGTANLLEIWLDISSAETKVSFKRATNLANPWPILNIAARRVAKGALVTRRIEKRHRK